MNRRWTCIALAAAMALPGLAAAQASPAAYPSKPIRLIVPYAVGGGTDILARMAGKEISDALGQPVIVENRPSAQGIAAMEYVAQAPADGYTLIMAPSGPLVMNPVMRKSLPYSSEKDFTPISIVGRLPLLITVNPAMPVHTVAELVSYAKANPEKISYASSAALFQLATELFKQRTGTNFLAIPYKSSGESITALMGGQVTIAIADLPPLAALLKAGKLRALAYTNETRSETFPDVPTVAEVGLQGSEVATLVGVIGPAGMPPDIVGKLQGVLVKMVAKPEVRKRFLDIGVEPVGSTAQEYANSIRRDLERWAAVAEKAGIRPE